MRFLEGPDLGNSTIYMTESREEKKPAPGRIQTLDLTIMRRVLHCCATTALLSVNVLNFLNRLLWWHYLPIGINTKLIWVSIKTLLTEFLLFGIVICLGYLEANSMLNIIR